MNRKGIRFNTGRTHFKKGSIPWNKGKFVSETYFTNCKHCGKEFKVIPSRKGATFCSKDCYIEHARENRHSSKIELTCKICGNNYKVWPCEENTSKYCSKKCSYIAKQRVTSWNKGLKTGPSWNKGLTKETDSRVDYERPTVFKKGHHLNLGSTKTMSSRIKMSMSKHPREKFEGFLEPERKLIRKSQEYVNWRKAVFERDNYTCQECGRKGDINAHHILPFAYYEDHRYDVNNGQTLCVDCHNKRHSDFYWFYSMKFNVLDFITVQMLRGEI